MSRGQGIESLGRYRRQIALAGFGMAGQEKLAGAHVAVLGAGGLGAPALLYLAGAGVGRITVIDDDHVELSNLHRQVIHSTARVGQLKADSARQAMLELNPDITVTAVSQRLEPATALGVLDGADVLIDGADNFPARHTASWACANLGIAHVWGSILGFEAQASVFDARVGPVYEDLFPVAPPPGAVPSCAEAGVLGPVVGEVGSLLAMEAIKVVTGVGTPLIGTLAFLDSLGGRWEYVPVQPNADIARAVRAGELLAKPAGPDGLACEMAAGNHGARDAGGARGGELAEDRIVEVDEIPEGAALLDVREDHEWDNYRLPGAVHLRLGEILVGSEIPDIDGAPAREFSGPIVVYCAGGVRSARAVAQLHKRGYRGLMSLRGGIDGWLDRHSF
ncbi:molybdopterin biosynthesis protein MoeB [Corynebacterium atypicum]|uniref:Molybdopterin biosynthesis protein MoeB n=1 Tax=Corynebacterium atypicum TaxID=191610 RepID=A0ABN4DFV7_9CORY|nr:ThiF family adenylyltransferase [Corynebacterium atypicum]AIG64319.1 molybdopterin biosynthesis protein MoeB [Corynebacterium atypicum]